MPLLKLLNVQSERKMKQARREVDLALMKMTKLLDQVEEQAALAKEELDGRRSR